MGHSCQQLLHEWRAEHASMLHWGRRQTWTVTGRVQVLIRHEILSSPALWADSASSMPSQRQAPAQARNPCPDPQLLACLWLHEHPTSLSEPQGPAQWHAFGIMSGGPESGSHCMTVVVRGDFTRKLAEDPPTHLWVRTFRFAGLPYTGRMYSSILVLATGGLPTMHHRPFFFSIFLGVFFLGGGGGGGGVWLAVLPGLCQSWLGAHMLGISWGRPSMHDEISSCAG